MIKYLKSIISRQLKQQTIGRRLILFNTLTLISVVFSLGLLYIWHEYDLKIMENKRYLNNELQSQVQSINDWFDYNSNQVKAVSRLQSVRNYSKDNMMLDFKASLISGKDFDHYLFVDKSGIVTVDTIAPVGINVSNRNYFQLGMQGQPHVTNVLVSRKTGQPVIIFSNPVFDYKDNSVIGVVFASASISKVNNAIERFKFGQTGKEYLINHNAKIIVQSGIVDTVGENIETNEGYRRAKMGLFGTSQYTNHQGRAVIGAYQSLPNRNLVLLIEVDESEVLQPLYDLIQTVAIGSAIILILAIFLSWHMSRSIQKPILMLLDTAKRTQSDDYSATIPEDKVTYAPVEIRTLCDAYNIMMGTINEHIALLHNSNEALLAAEEKYRKLSIYDQLTQIYNRTFFDAEVSRLQSLQQIPVGVVVCDVDGLKIINDTLGHKAGDDLIRAVASCIVKSFPDNATVARIGGDEFAVLMPNATVAEVDVCIRLLKSTITEQNKIHSELPLAISSGRTVADKLPLNLEDTINDADHYMYQEKNQNRSCTRQELLDALIQTAGKNDNNYFAHIEGVKEYALTLGKAMKLDREALRQIELAVQYHDIGKVGVPKEILTKIGALTEEEWAKIKTHADIGGRLAKSITELASVADFITYHHERWDGSGYPDQRVGEEIPLISRIIAIADAFDAMQRNNSYRQAKSLDEAKQELVNCAGGQFDPKLVKLFLMG